MPGLPDTTVGSAPMGGSEDDIPSMKLAVLGVQVDAMQGVLVDVKYSVEGLRDAVSKLVLIEERQSVTSQAIERLFAMIAKIDARLGTLEKSSGEGLRTTRWVDAFIFAVLTVTLAFAAKKVGLL